MPSGYRYIIVALVGWLSLGLAPPKDSASDPQNRTNREIAAALNNVASALQKPTEASKHDEPCYPGDNKRSSDLCAQWKAADAAKSAAQSNWWLGIVGSLISALTLAAAWAAARWAKKAAIETEKGAKAAADAVTETRRIGEAQVRCYLTGISADLGFVADGTAIIKCKVKNAGQSPARNVHRSAELYYSVGKGAKFFKSFKKPDAVERFRVDISAGSEETITGNIAANHAELTEPGEEAGLLTAVVTFTATDVFDLPVEETERFIVLVNRVPAINKWVSLHRGARIIDVPQGDNERS
jgi:hypothetical protein